jgi:hypothetical protein
MKWLTRNLMKLINNKLYEHVEDLQDSLVETQTINRALVLMYLQKEEEVVSYSTNANIIVNSFLLWSGGSLVINKDIVDAAHSLPPFLINNVDGGMEFSLGVANETEVADGQ